MIRPPDGDLAAFFKRALQDELPTADAYASANPRVTLSGAFTKVELDSSWLSQASWTLAATVRSTNGQSASVEVQRPFESAYPADIACRNAAEALMPTMQDLVFKLVHSDGFPALVK